ncbi:hypothetical protein [Acinetobacter sp. ANC 3813]|uniref:defense against restriction DarA-related protein n=1 Tax=Acinetobacter sp. ANC 3813 TaxID=1977873 RepID=UPI000A3573C5|nr:hypothetical protein [Acinetobacter sp. ANC 3813]OTG87872.1 hypothetical protein B9T34_16175 [Acinetobacter sp. ANC 3813]
MIYPNIFIPEYKTGQTIRLTTPTGQMLDSCDGNLGKLKGYKREIKAVMCDGAEDSAQWRIFNLVNDNGYFLDHAAVYGAVSDSQAQMLCMKYLAPSFACKIHSHSDLTDNALKTFLDGANPTHLTPYLLQSDVEFLDSVGTSSAVQWDGETLISHNGLIANVMLDMARSDVSGQLVEQLTAKEAADFILDDQCSFAMLDAMIIKNSQLDRVIEKMAEALRTKNTEEFFVKNVTLIEPFKRLGVVNVGAIFEMSDSQTLTVLFNNPDATPAKLTGADIITSWKWILNKRDVTAVLQPRAVDAKKYPMIAGRIFKLLAQNHDRFKRAQMMKNRDELLLNELVTQLESGQSEMSQLDGQIQDVQHEIDAESERKRLDAESAMAAAAGNNPDDTGNKTGNADNAEFYSDDFNPTAAENYQKILSNGEVLEHYQDHLDSMFQSRIIAVRNALRELGWDGEKHKTLSKNGLSLSFDYVQKGGGGNIVGMTLELKEVGFSYQDDLSLTPEELAQKINDAEDQDMALQYAFNLLTKDDQAFIAQLKGKGMGKISMTDTGVIAASRTAEGEAESLNFTSENGLMTDFLLRSMQFDDVDSLIDTLQIPEVPQVTGAEFGDPNDTAAIRKAVKQAMLEMTGKSYPCPALGAEVEVRKNGTKKIIKFSADVRKLQAISALKELLENAVKYDERPPYNPEEEQNIKAYHFLHSAFLLNGESLIARFVVREDDKGHYHYDHTIHGDLVSLLGMAKNAKSPLLDGLSTAVFPTAGVSQDELAKLTRLANCQLDVSIENDQINVNSMLDGANGDDAEVLNMYIAKNEQDEQNVQMNNVSPEPSENEQFLNAVIAGTADMLADATGDKLEQIGENLDEALTDLFEQAVNAYTAAALNNAKSFN